MAIDETQPGRRELPRQPEPPPYGRPLLPAIRWGAVLAGVAVGIAAQLVLTLFGLASGLSAAEASQGGALGTGPLLWAGFTMLIAAFIGGYVAARMSGLKRTADGVLHGAVSWAVTTILFAMLATSIGGTLVGGVFSNMSQLAGTNAAAGESPLPALLRSQGARMDADALRQLQQYLQDGQREQAVQLLANATGLDPARAAAVVDQALIAAGSPAASPQGRAATENAMRGAGKAAWVVFAAVVLALAIGIGGGVAGAAGSRRISWAGATPRA